MWTTSVKWAVSQTSHDLGVAEREAEGDIVGDGVLEDLRFLGEEGDGFVEAVEPDAGVGRGIVRSGGARGGDGTRPFPLDLQAGLGLI